MECLCVQPKEAQSDRNKMVAFKKMKSTGKTRPDWEKVEEGKKDGGVGCREELHANEI